MFPLRSGRAADARWSGKRAGAGWPSGDVVVLPRWLRRPARHLQRLHAGEIEPPRFGATMATAALFAATAAYGTVAGGHMQSVVQSVTARTGFAIEEVRVSGNGETSEIDILQEVGLDGWTALIGFDAGAARARIKALPWVESVAVRKIYPATVSVEVVEKTPFAIWQHDNALTLIERDGTAIAPFDGVASHAALPMVIGDRARETGPAFIERVAAYRGLAPRVRAYIRVGDRRWNLRLRNGVTVKLPEQDEDLVLAELMRLDRRHDLLSRDITSVDMRLPDRLAIGLNPEDAQTHLTTMKERLRKAREEARI